jgi:hypothetical protein
MQKYSSNVMRTMQKLIRHMCLALTCGAYTNSHIRQEDHSDQLRFSFVHFGTQHMKRPSNDSPIIGSHDACNSSLYDYLRAMTPVQIKSNKSPVKTEMQTPCPISSAEVKEPTPAAADHAGNKLIDPETLLLQLSSEEKIRLLSGDDMWHTAPVLRLGIPRVRVCDMTSAGSLLWLMDRCRMARMGSEVLRVSLLLH